MLDYILMPAAERFFRKVKESDPVLLGKYKVAIKAICEDPYKGTFKKGDLTGYMGYDIIYNNINYEMAYIIGKNADGKIIVIVMAGTRENFYKELKNYNKANKKNIKKLKG